VFRQSTPTTIITSPDAKKEAFRHYIQDGSLKKALIRAIVALFEEWEKPDDPLLWIARYLGFGIPSLKTIEESKNKIVNLRAKVSSQEWKVEANIKCLKTIEFC